mgnify:CR=1 FL=1
MEDNKIHLYADRPEVGSDLKFAHKVLAKWLEKVIADVQAPFRLAITGKLGSGKSTVVHNALEHFEKQSDKYAVAYVDVWKLDHSSARRSTILRVAKDFGIDLESERYKKLHRSMYGSVNTVDDVKPIKSLANDVALHKQPIVWFVGALTLCVFAVSYFLISNYSATLVSDKVPEWLKIIVSAVVATSIAVSNVISQKILQIKSSVNQAPFVGPEEFENAFQAILDDPKLANKKAIVVFDNIDRAPKAKTEEILTGISAFFDHSSRSTFRNLIILVPFSNITNKELDESTVQKFFDAIIPLPVLMPEDLLDFTREKLIGVGWGKDADEVAQLVDRSDLKTPRSILHFVNEITAQISLAESLETVTYRNEENADATYLAKGSLTKNKVFYAKLKLCERIHSNFIWDAIIDYKSAHEVFNLENFKDAKEGTDRKKLFDFLRATESIPERLPESLEQFMYFKGSDLELSISGSSALMEAMNNRSSEDIKAFYEKNNNFDSIEKLFVNNFARNKNNALRMKNSILSVLEAFEDISSESLRKELARAVNKLKGSIHDLPIRELNKITPIQNDALENEGVWKQLDEIYQEQKKETNGTTKEIEAWRVEYLRYVLQQPKGAERASLNSGDFKAQYFEDEKLFPIIKKNGLKKFVGSTNLPSVFEYIEGKAFSLPVKSLQDLGEALNIGIENSGANDVSRIQAYFNKISEQFTARVGQPPLLKEFFNNLFEHLKNFETAKAPETMWATIANAIEGQTGHLNNLVASGGELELVSFLIFLNQKTALNGRGNQLTYVRNYLNKVTTIEQLKALSDKFGSWNWVESANKMLPAELEAVLKKDGIAISFAMSADTKGADYLVASISKLIVLNSFEELFKAIPDSSETNLAKKDFVDNFYENPKTCDFKKAQIIFDYLLTQAEPVDVGNASKVVTHYLDQAKVEENVSYLLNWCARKSLNIISLLNSYKENLERDDNTVWDDDSALRFFAVINGNVSRPKDFYETFFNKAIERGIFSATSPAVVKKVSGVLEKTWSTSARNSVTESLLKDYKNAIEKTTHLQEAERTHLLNNLETVANKNNLGKELGFEKPSFLSSMTDKISELVSGKDVEK